LRLDHREQPGCRNGGVGGGAARAHHIDRHQRRRRVRRRHHRVLGMDVERPAKWKFLIGSLSL